MQRLTHQFAMTILLSITSLPALSMASERGYDYYLQFVSNECKKGREISDDNMKVHECGQQVVDASVKELETTFKQVLASIDMGILDESYKDALKQSQAYWEKHRDTEHYMATELTGGSGAGSVAGYSVMTEMNYNRIQDLRKQYLSQ